MTERLYYADSFLTDFDAVVTDIQEVSRASGQSLWRVALDRSAFYPTSGGQPFDTGSLIATARSGAELTAEIVDVEEDDHGEVWHHTAKPLLAGTQVRGAVNAARRLDHVQQHSGQHLLSAAFLRICGAPTVSFHLGETISTIDLATESLAEETMERVEKLANRTIAEDRTVSVSLVPRAQAEAWLATGELRKLPPREGDLRIVEIRDFDRNACGGTHVRSTGQIGSVHLRGIEKVKQGLRVEFVCGLRAMLTAHDDFRRLTEVSRQLSVGAEEVSPAIARMQTEARAAIKRMQRLTTELAEYHAMKLIRETPSQDGLRLIRLELSPANDTDVGYAKLLASRIATQGERTVALIGWLPERTREQESDCEPATLVLARSRDLNFDCGTMLRETLTAHGGRGGGSKDMAQGSIPVERLSSAMDDLTVCCQRAT